MSPRIEIKADEVDTRSYLDDSLNKDSGRANGPIDDSNSDFVASISSDEGFNSQSSRLDFSGKRTPPMIVIDKFKQTSPSPKVEATNESTFRRSKTTRLGI